MKATNNDAIMQLFIDMIANANDAAIRGMHRSIHIEMKHRGIRCKIEDENAIKTV
jgi:DNA gyrase/topoisomerase IV subunit B